MKTDSVLLSQLCPYHPVPEQCQRTDGALTCAVHKGYHLRRETDSRGTVMYYCRYTHIGKPEGHYLTQSQWDRRYEDLSDEREAFEKATGKGGEPSDTGTVAEPRGLETPEKTDFTPEEPF